jgi:hypothetical protein
VSFFSGVISVYDIKNGYSLVGDVDDQNIQRLNTQSLSSHGESIKTIIVETLSLDDRRISGFRVPRLMKEGGFG